MFNSFKLFSKFKIAMLTPISVYNVSFSDCLQSYFFYSLKLYLPCVLLILSRQIFRKSSWHTADLVFASKTKYASRKLSTNQISQPRVRYYRNSFFFLNTLLFFKFRQYSIIIMNFLEVERYVHQKDIVSRLTKLTYLDLLRHCDTQNA